MYEQFFGLQRQPFKITPDTSLFYDGGRRGDILEALTYAIDRGEGIIKVVGEVGSGKTMLCRMLQQSLPATVLVVYLANPSISANDILFVIAREMGISIPEHSSKHEVLHLLQERLLKLHADNRQVVLFVEEAQSMPLETLEEMRLLSNLETDQDKLLQIILFGQPELDVNLSDASIRQLRERITHNFQLMPLHTEDIHRYLNFRMREVGYTGPEIISLEIAKQLEKASNGLMRRVNILADKMLLAAFAENTHTLTSSHVKAAIDDSEFGTVGKRSETPRWLPWAVLALLLLSILTLALWLMSSGHLQQLLAKNDQQASPKSPVELAQPTRPQQSAESTLPADKEMELVSHAQDEVAKPLTAAETESLEKTETPEQSQASELAVADENFRTEADESVAMLPQETPTEAVAESVDSAPPEVLKNLAIEPTPISSAVKIPALNDSEWLEQKLLSSRVWLENANSGKYSMQVMTRSKSAVDDLTQYLRYQWPLDQNITYVYEVELNNSLIYRVFYSEFASLDQGREAISLLPTLIQQNLPYLQSIRRMQAAILSHGDPQGVS